MDREEEMWESKEGGEEVVVMRDELGDLRKQRMRLQR